MINNQLLDELKTILLEDYGLKIQENDISEIANTLVRFFELLLAIDQVNNSVEAT